MHSHPFLTIADRAARIAGKIILEGLKRLDFIRKKQKQAEKGIVTEIDLQAEEAIINIIQKAYPHHGILAEESNPIEGSQCTWIIDPLDGTSNFIHDFPHFAVSIAVKDNERNCIECGLIYDPLRQEVFTATKGGGAYLNNMQRFHRRLRVGNQPSIQKSLLGISIPSRGGLEAHKSPINKEALRAMMAQSSGIRRTGAATLDLAYVAGGRLDAVLELDLAPWDMAAGILLVQEAGGLVCDLNGEDNYFQTGHVVAANSKLCSLILEAISPKTNHLKS